MVDARVVGGRGTLEIGAVFPGARFLVWWSAIASALGLAALLVLILLVADLGARQRFELPRREASGAATTPDVSELLEELQRSTGALRELRLALDARASDPLVLGVGTPQSARVTAVEPAPAPEPARGVETSSVFESRAKVARNFKRAVPFAENSAALALFRELNAREDPDEAFRSRFLFATFEELLDTLGAPSYIDAKGSDWKLHYRFPEDDGRIVAFLVNSGICFKVDY